MQRRTKRFPKSETIFPPTAPAGGFLQIRDWLRKEERTSGLRIKGRVFLPGLSATQRFSPVELKWIQRLFAISFPLLRQFTKIRRTMVELLCRLTRTRIDALRDALRDTLPSFTTTLKERLRFPSLLYDRLQKGSRLDHVSCTCRIS